MAEDDDLSPNDDLANLGLAIMNFTHALAERGIELKAIVVDPNGRAVIRAMASRDRHVMLATSLEDEIVGVKIRSQV